MLYDNIRWIDLYCLSIGNPVKKFCYASSHYCIVLILRFMIVINGFIFPAQEALYDNSDSILETGTRDQLGDGYRL